MTTSNRTKAHQRYQLADNSFVPSVTTILGRFKESGGLIYWAWTQGRDGKDFREERDVAADAGTLAHSLVQAHIEKRNVEQTLIDAKAIPEIADKATQAFSNYLTWESQTGVKVIALETPMISERHKFGGTPDALFEINGKLHMADWKSSNAIYGDYLLQLAGYRILWDENHPENTITGGYHICRFAKEHGDFAHHYYDNLDEAQQMFLLLKDAYALDRLLKKRV